MNDIVKRLLASIGILEWIRSFIRMMVAREYRRQFRINTDLKKFIENVSESELTGHYSVSETKEDAVLLHLSYQLYGLLNAVASRLPKIGEDTAILDAGDSDGFFLERLGGKGTGLNILPECVEKIKSKGLKAVRGDVEKMPFGDNEFDYGLCFETLEHLKNPNNALMELQRICKKKVFLSIPWVKKTRIHESGYGVKNGNPADEQHVFEFDHSDFLKILSYTDFEVIDYKELKVFPPVYNPFKWLIFKFGWFPSHFHMLQFYELSINSSKN